MYCFFSYPESEFSLFNIYQGSSNGQERPSKQQWSFCTKSIGKMNFPTLMSTSSRTPSGYAIVLSSIWKVIAVGVSSPKLSLFTTDNGIKLMLAPRELFLHFCFLKPLREWNSKNVSLFSSLFFNSPFSTHCSVYTSSSSIFSVNSEPLNLVSFPVSSLFFFSLFLLFLFFSFYLSSTLQSHHHIILRILLCINREGCHAPIPGPTRLANPNRFRGAKPYIWDSLPFFFFFQS